TGMDRGMYREEVIIRPCPDVRAAGRDNPCGHRPAEAERIADCNHPVADPRIAVSEGHEWKTAGAIDLDQGNVGVLIRADHLCGKNTAVIRRNLDLVGRFDDMEVGHRVAVSRNEKAGALTGEDVAAAGGGPGAGHFRLTGMAERGT